jgi:hypothetical protein
MCPTNPQKDIKSEKGNEPFSGTASEMEFSGSIGAKNPQATCPPKRVRAGGSAPQTKCSLSVTVISFHALAGREDSRTIER